MTSEVVLALATVRFRTPAFGKGYDRHEVDALVRELTAAAVAGQDLAGIIDRTMLSEAPKAQAYSRSSVDGTLRDIVRKTTMGPIGRAVEDVRFTPTKLGGYDMGEVDQLLDRLVDAELRGEPVAPLVSKARFATRLLIDAYSKKQVDSFLEDLVLRIEGVQVIRQADTPTWHFQLPQDGSVPGTATWIRGTTFTRQEFLAAYAADRVVQLREALALAVEAGRPVDEVIRAARLQGALKEVGCDVPSVEHWLDLVRSGGVEAPAETDDVIRRIREVRFTPTRLRASYAMGDVDQLLDRLVDARRSARPLAPVIQAAELPEVTLREGYSIAEVDALLDQLRDELA